MDDLAALLGCFLEFWSPIEFDTYTYHTMFVLRYSVSTLSTIVFGRIISSPALLNSFLYST